MRDAQQLRIKNSLYDSYIRAIRWASDRIGTSGVIGFVTNAGFVDANTADGMRKCLVEEFSSIYIFHLRGNQRTSGELSKKEGGKIFGSGSRAPIAISILVKNPTSAQHGSVYFHDIGDYLSREEKLERIRELISVEGILIDNAWQEITPDEHGDWLSQRDSGFANYLAVGSKAVTSERTLFEDYSSGVKTQRDAWCYNFSKRSVEDNVLRTINFYNAEVERFDKIHGGDGKAARAGAVEAFIDSDSRKISWTRALKEELVKSRALSFDRNCMVRSMYRPFTKQWLYFNRRLNEMVYRMPRIFPDAKGKERCHLRYGSRRANVFSACYGYVAVFGPYREGTVFSYVSIQGKGTYAGI